MSASILSQAWRVYRERFGLIAGVIVAVWLPCELLSSYLETFVLAPDDLRHSFRISQLLDNFIGIIATAGVTYIALTTCSGDPVTFGAAMRVGFGTWGRMCWTRFLTSTVSAFGFLLLIIPGVYLLTRLCFVDSIVVVEHTSGFRATQRSFELTRNRFWPTFRFGLVLVVLVVLPLGLLILPTALVPSLDHWLIGATLDLVGNVIAAFGTVALLCGYEAYANEPGAAVCSVDLAARGE